MAFAADNRMALEYVACGLPFSQFTDGVPEFSPALDAAGATLRGLIDAAHIADDGVCGQSGYLNQDLNSGATYTALYALLTPTQKANYQGVQKDMIDDLRYNNCACGKGAIMALIQEISAAADISTANFTVTKNSMATCCAQYPYPTSY